MKGFNPPRPAQSECRLCTRLFAYFQTTRRRRMCTPCVDIAQNLNTVQSNDLMRRMRLEARETARLVHMEAEMAA